MRALHLFAGAGGSVLAGRMLGWESVGAVELDPFCCAVLAGHGERVLARDVTTFDARSLRGHVDVVVGGWPCQDLSVAGKRAGLAGARSGLFWQMMRIVDECEPRFVFGENVPGLLSSNGGRDFSVVLGALAERGFDAQWQVLGARDVGAPHRRNRVWIVANATGSTRRGQTGIMGTADENSRENTGDALHRSHGMVHAGGGDIPDRNGKPDCVWVPTGLAGPSGGGMANANAAQCAGDGVPSGYATEHAAAGCDHGGHAESGMGGKPDGLADGLDWPATRGEWPAARGAAQAEWEAPRTVTGKVPDRVSRLRALGNGWVPQCAVAAWVMMAKARSVADKQSMASAP